MIKCPLFNKKIEDIICFDISMVAEHLAPLTTIPPEIRDIKDFKEICLNCPNHRSD